MDDPILIWGAGAIGGTLGAYWARAGENVVMVDIVAEHVQACRTDGLSISGPVETFTQIVPSITADELEGRFSRIVLAVKAQATEVAAHALAPHLADDGYVLSAQNGLNELTIAGIVGEERTMGAFVNFGADWHGPGDILFGNRGAVVVGEIDGSVRDRTRDMHRLLSIFEPDAVLTPDIWSYLWGKLGYGALLFATALTDDSIADVLAMERYRPTLTALASELTALADLQGSDALGFNGYAPEAFRPDADPEALQSSFVAMTDHNARSAKSHSGIWRDLAVRKRRTEVDPQLTLPVEIGGALGMKMPLTRKLIALIQEIERGQRPQSLETLDSLKGAYEAGGQE